MKKKKWASNSIEYGKKCREKKCSENLPFKALYRLPWANNEREREIQKKTQLLMVII